MVGTPITKDTLTKETHIELFNVIYIWHTSLNKEMKT
jgi:hypothetical protein